MPLKMYVDPVTKDAVVPADFTKYDVEVDAPDDDGARKDRRQA